MNNYDSIYAKVSEMICDAKDLDIDDLNPDAPLTALELDSLDYVELMILARREFGVTLSADLFVQHPTMTLRELCEYFVKETAA
ncbi:MULTISPECIES: acyl carrier protein [Tenebrionibacter/Tenebrionicola group]|jgi:acyl carrier protein|uniref:Acyl carrier protein n=2 Tax=Tenebrionibacter/Tenebrionicola group TaxID=2969848 RepID=A0A8K0XWZ2_9ENTR|nr:MULTISPECIES: acyl carrier protein [Tenebrionibacter/Tenebrionicola group]MBK4715083.1 acyl carrier protein [Tenebrionibacter intestinalis]MBV4414043.1 acyl carrier protein [Tenebrionicola larvae]MBV5096257.1 acyl carrier protein [Tenebrionicola larvae]